MERVKLLSERYRINRIPKTCGECPFFEIRYRPTCKLGYMWQANSEALSEFDGYAERYPKCYVESDKRVIIQ